MPAPCRPAFRTPALAGLLAVATLTLGLVPAAARAQATDDATIVKCLCLNKSVEAMKSDFEAKRAAYEQEKAGVEATAAELAETRKQIELHQNSPQTRSYERRNAEYEKRQTALNTVTVPAVQGAADTLNKAVDQANGQCSGIKAEPKHFEDLKQSLSCPVPQ